jgi:lipopolysaccharide transport system permease protein
MAYYGLTPSLAIVTLPLFFILAVVTTLGIGLWMSALNARFRDFRYISAFLVQTWLLATPVAYPSSLLGEPWRTIYGLNPMAGVVEGFRWSLLGLETAPGPMILVSALIALLLLLGGAFYFKRTEREFVDLV